VEVQMNAQAIEIRLLKYKSLEVLGQWLDALVAVDLQTEAALQMKREVTEELQERAMEDDRLIALTHDQQREYQRLIQTGQYEQDEAYQLAKDSEPRRGLGCSRTRRSSRS
jgi:hypothetical protein